MIESRIRSLRCLPPKHLQQSRISRTHMVRAHRGLLQTLNRMVNHSSNTGSFFVRHSSGRSCFVEKYGAVDNEEVVGGGHVAERFGLDKVVESGEEGFRGV